MEIDKREYERISDAIQVKFTQADKKWSSIPYSTSYTKNMSEGGFLFYSKNPIDVGSNIEIKFFLKDSTNFVSAIARVVRIGEISSNNLYEIGISFVDIEQQTMNILSKYILKKNN